MVTAGSPGAASVVTMRVAIVTESFLPSVNGVAGTVRHVVDRLVATGHEVLVVAPDSRMRAEKLSLTGAAERPTAKSKKDTAPIKRARK